jgi:L-aminopeptidase/D-esterase-like protein
VLLVVGWYVVSSISNNISKQILDLYATPFTLTYVQVRRIAIAAVGDFGRCLGFSLIFGDFFLVGSSGSRQRSLPSR